MNSPAYLASIAPPPITPTIALPTRCRLIERGPPPLLERCKKQQRDQRKEQRFGQDSVGPV